MKLSWSVLIQRGPLISLLQLLIIMETAEIVFVEGVCDLINSFIIKQKGNVM